MPEFPHLRRFNESEAAPFQGLPDRDQQYFVIERLRQELDRPSLHCSDRHWNIAVSRDKDDRHVGALDGHALLQFETIEAGEGNVENETTRSQCPRPIEEVLCCGERLWLPAFVLYQGFQRL